MLSNDDLVMLAGKMGIPLADEIGFKSEFLGF